MISSNWRQRLTNILSAVGKEPSDVDLEGLADDLQQAEVGLAMRQTLRLFPSDKVRLDELAKVRKAAKGLIDTLAPEGATEAPPHILGALALQHRLGAPSEDDVRSTLAIIVEAAAKLDQWSKEAANHIQRPPPSDPKIHTPAEKPETWLIGKKLPDIYEKHFGKWPVSKSGGVPVGAGVDFVLACAEAMGIPATPSMIDVYRRRQRGDTHG